MLKGLALTPPTIGRISIGKVVERNGKRLPEKSDEFTITTLAQNKDGWILHPADEELRKDQAKLRSIPVRLLFDDPALNMRVNFSLFDRLTGRPVCVGNGETCRRSTHSGVQTMPCPSPDGCELAEKGCKPFGRLNVRIGDEDALGGTFLFRTSGVNSIRTLLTRMHYFQAVVGGHLSTLPLELRLRGKSTTQSHRAPIYFVDLTIRSGMTALEAIRSANEESTALEAAGFSQVRLDAAARDGFALGAFEESAEEGIDVVEEFYPDQDVADTSTPRDTTSGKPLISKLETKVKRLGAQAGETTAGDGAFVVE